MPNVYMPTGAKVYSSEGNLANYGKVGTIIAAPAIDPDGIVHHDLREVDFDGEIDLIDIDHLVNAY